MIAIKFEPEAGVLRSLLRSPLALAAVVTAANALKPVTVDDTAYLAYARHISSHPTDPYGFTAFWWDKPQEALHILVPPVVPYWLALGMSLFGESPAVLKLWMFPFVLTLAVSLRALLARFARGAEGFALPLLMLSPAVLPTVNLMLDVPATALALASVALFIHLTPARPVGGGVLVGALAALAMQTKYTGLVAPSVIVWYATTHRRSAFAAVIAVAVCAVLFVGWEQVIARKYGQSHFWYHTRVAAGAPPKGANPVSGFLEDKLDLLPPLVGHFGCLGVGVGLLAGSALRARRGLAWAAWAWAAGFVLVALLPRRWTVVVSDITFATVFWQASGWLWAAAAVGCAGLLLFRVKRGVGLRFSADSWFVVGWVVIEAVAALGLTPFPAARRVIGVTLAVGLLAARAVSRVQIAHPERRPPRWILAVGVGAGVAVAALDTFDALPEKVCAERCAERIPDRPAGSTAWYVGHWGFQYYCERAGMRSLIAGQTVVRAGDYLVTAVYPEDEGFYRPYAGFTVTQPDEHAEVVAEVVWEDWLSAQTVPSFFGGRDPITGRDHPRLRVRVYRFTADWVMGK